MQRVGQRELRPRDQERYGRECGRCCDDCWRWPGAERVRVEVLEHAYVRPCMKATWEEISGAKRLRPSLDHALDAAFMTFGAARHPQGARRARRATGDESDDHAVRFARSSGVR
jgi:hypothetical protein